MSSLLDLGALVARVIVEDAEASRTLTLLMARFKSLGAEASGATAGTAKLDEGLVSVGSSAGKATAGLDRAAKATQTNAAAEQKAAVLAERHAKATADLAAVMADTAKVSDREQQAFLRLIAAEERLNAVQEGGKATTAQLASAMSSLIGAERSLSRAQTDSAGTTTTLTDAMARQAGAAERIEAIMASVAGESVAVQRATLQAAAAQERLSAAQEGGKATAAQLASAQSAVIGADERLVAAQRAAASSTTALAGAQRESAVAARSATGGLAGTVKMAGQLGLVFGAYEAVKKAIDITKEANEFQRSMVQVQTNADVTAAEVRKASSALLNMAGPVAAAPNELSTAWYHAKSVGLDYAKSITTTRIAAEGARVGHADLEETMNALTSTVASNIPGVKNMSSAMGQLIATVGAGDMKLSDLNQALGSGILTVVKGYGLSLTDVGAALATFGDNNIRGADAATMLRMAVQAMAVPAKNGADELARLGLSTDTLAKDMQSGGLNKAILDLKAHLDAAHVGANQVGAVLTEVFGKRAGPGLAVLIGQVDRLQSKFAVLRDAGSSFGEKWKATTQTASFALARLGHAAEAAGIQLTARLGPYIAQAATWLGTTLPKAIETLSSIIGPIAHDVGTVLGGAWQVAAAAASAFGSVLTSVGHFMQAHAGQVRAVGEAVLAMWAAYKGYQIVRAAFTAINYGLGSIVAKMSQASTGARLFASNLTTMSTASLIGKGAMAGLGIALGVATYAWSQHQQAVAENRAAIDGYTDAIREDNGALGTNTRALVENNLVKANAYAQGRTLGISQKTLTDAALGNASAMDKASAAIDKNRLAGGQAGVASVGLGGTLQLTNRQLKSAEQNNKDLAAANKTTASSSTASGAAARAQAQAMARQAQAARQAAEQAKLLDTALQNLAQTQLAAAQTEDAFREGILSLTKTIHSNHDQLNKNTQAGLANRDALLQMLGQAVSLANAQRKNGQSIDSVTHSLQGNVQQLIQTAVHAGLSRQQVNALVRQMGLTPKQIATKFQLTGAEQAISELQRARDMLAAIHNKTVAVTVVTQAHGPGESTTIGGHSAAGSNSWAPGGKLPPGYSTAGERGWELLHTDSSGRTEVIEHHASMAMTGLPDVLPGFANGTSGNIAAIASLLKGMGATRAGIAGFLGNTKIESGFRTTAYNPNENAHGFQQWEGGRLTVLQNIADRMGKSITALPVQLAMIRHELTHGYGDTLNKLRHATSARSAAAYVDAHYERSSGDARQARENAAAALYGRLGHISGAVASSGARSGPAKPAPVPKLTAAQIDRIIGKDNFKLITPALSKFAKSATSAVTSAIAAAVRPADTSNRALSAALSSRSGQAKTLRERAMQANTVYDQQAAHAAKLAKQVRDLEAGEKRESATQKKVTDQALAELKKRADAAQSAASRAKDAWGKAASAAKDAEQAAQDAAKALVDSLSQQASDLADAVSGFRSTITQGLTAGSDLSTVWSSVLSAQSDATDGLATANQNLADAQQAVADAQQAINDAQPDTNALTAAQNAKAQAQAQYQAAHTALLAAAQAVSAGTGTPAQYAALIAAQARQTATLTNLSAATADLTTAQQNLTTVSGPTQDQLDALTTAQTNLATATTAASAAAAAAAANTGSGANLQAAFDKIKAGLVGFDSDLNKIVALGGNQDLISQIVGLGPDQGDVLAKQLLAGGQAGIAALQTTMTSIQNLAGSESAKLAKGYYGAGESSIEQLIKGMVGKFPALEAALAPEVAKLQAMFASVGATAGVTAPGSNAGSTNVATKVVTVGAHETLGQFATANHTTIAAIEQLNASLAHASSKHVVNPGVKITIPGFSSGIENFGGGLAYVHSKELVNFNTNSVTSAPRTADIFDMSGLERRIDATNARLDGLAGKIADGQLAVIDKYGQAHAKAQLTAARGRSPF